MNESISLNEEKTFEKNSHRLLKTNILFVVAYFILSGLCFLFIFVRLSTLTAVEGGTELVNFIYNIKTLPADYYGSIIILHTNALMANVLYFGTGVLMFFLAVILLLKLLIKNKKLLKAIKITYFSLCALLVLLISTTYPPMTAALTEFFSWYRGTTSVFLWLAYFFPITILCIMVTELVLEKKSIGNTKNSFSIHKFGYVAVFILSVIAFALPLKFSKDIGSVYMLAPAGFRTLFGEVRARASLLLLTCSVLSLLALGVSSIKELTLNNKLKKAFDLIIVGISVLFVIVLIYCLPATINLLSNIDMLAFNTVGSDGKIGIGLYLFFIAPVLGLVLLIISSIRIIRELLSKSTMRSSSGLNSGVTIISIVYLIFFLQLLLSLAIPYGHYDFGDYKTPFFVLNYIGKSTDYVGNILPNPMRAYTFVILVFVVLFLALFFNTLFSKKMAIRTKATTIISFYIKPLIAICATMLFVIDYYIIAEYARILASAPSVTADISIVPTIIKIAAIGTLIMVWCDAIYGLWVYSKAKAKK